MAALNEQIISKAPVGILVYRADGQCVLANTAMAVMAGTDRQVLLTQNFLSLDSWRHSGLTTVCLSALADGQAREHEIHHHSSFGKVFWADIRVAPLLMDGAQHVLLIGSDITERKRMEAELKRVNEAVMRSTAAILLTDPSGRIDFVNPAFARLFGYSAADCGPRSLDLAARRPVLREANRIELDGLPERKELRLPRTVRNFPVQIKSGAASRRKRRHDRHDHRRHRSYLSSKGPKWRPQTAIPGQDRLSSPRYQPRDPHPDERHHRHGPSRPVRDSPAKQRRQVERFWLRTESYGHPERYSRFLEDRAGNVDIEKSEFDINRLIDDTVAAVIHLAEGKHLDLGLEIAPEVPAAMMGDSFGLGRRCSTI